MTKIITAVVTCLLLCQRCAGQENWEPLGPALQYEVRCLRMEAARKVGPLEEELRKAEEAGDEEKKKKLSDDINRLIWSIKMQREEDYWAEVVKKQAEHGRVWAPPPRKEEGEAALGYWKETKGLTAAQEKEVKRSREEMQRLLKRVGDPGVAQRHEEALQMPDLQYWNYLVAQRARGGFRWHERPVDSEGKCEGHWEPVRR